MADIKITKVFYKKVRNNTKDPIEILYLLYKEEFGKDLKVHSIESFQDALTLWLNIKRLNLVQGSLLILKYFDLKFA